MKNIPECGIVATYMKQPKASLNPIERETDGNRDTVIYEYLTAHDFG
jgi:hypothetical protein